MVSNRVAIIIIISILVIGFAGFFIFNSVIAGKATNNVDTNKLSPVQQSVLSKPVQIVGNYYKFSSESSEKDGKVRVLFIGAEFCPFCAAERWPVVESLKRFGQFGELKSTTSATAQGEASDITTYNFVGIDYKSEYIKFDHKETGDRNYNELEQLTDEEKYLFSRYNPRGSIPFLMISGKNGIFVQVGSGYSPGTLNGLRFSDLKTDLESGKQTASTKSINSESDIITALICYNNNNQPENVCNEEKVHQEISAIYVKDK